MTDRKKDMRKTGLKIAAVFFALIMLVSCVLMVLEVWDRHRGGFADGDDTPAPAAVRTYNGNRYMLKDNVETMLLLGLDTYEDTATESYNNKKQADFILLLVRDKDTNVCKAIHINRDTMADINVLGVAGDKIGTVNKQIALAHTYGNGREVSCRNVANAVSGLLGVEVDHYVSVTMAAVAVYNDVVGGVTLEVIQALSSADPALALGNTVTLQGAQALTYVRARYGLEDLTNEQRMKRQKQYLEALYAKSRDCMAADSEFVPRAALAMADYIVSDCSGNKLESTLSRYAENKLTTVHTVQGETVAGAQFAEFYPAQSSIDAIVIDCFYEMID